MYCNYLRRVFVLIVRASHVSPVILMKKIRTTDIVRMLRVAAHRYKHETSRGYERNKKKPFRLVFFFLSFFSVNGPTRELRLS